MENDSMSARPIAKVTLPGVLKEDLKVEVHDTHLTISARRNAEVEKMKEVVYHNDRHGKSFFRSILLPDGVNVSQIRATFNDGVLEVSVLQDGAPAPRKRRDGFDTASRAPRAWRPPMVEIRTILCPIDFSDHSRHALESAAGLAAWYGASVSALHVRQTGVPSPAVDPLIVPVAVPPVVVTEEDRGAALRRLHEFIAAGKAYDAKIDSRVDDAVDIASAILARANAVHADLIALGTNGQSSPHAGKLGSVASDVLAGSSCAVLCVPSRSVGGLPRGPVSFRRIVCPVDFSESSRRALGYAASLARDANAWLTVVHVVELSSEVAAVAPDFDAHREVRLEPARRSLRELVAATVPGSIALEELLQMGTPQEEIVHLVEEQDAGLLVMGLHGPNGDNPVRPGATIRLVVPRSPCPVLVVP